MYRKLLLLAVAVCPVLALSQPFAIGHISTSFTDASRGNRNIPVEIYYPAQTQGDNTAVATGPFPVLAFGHGFVMGYDAYANIWEAIVPRGYIMVLPKTETGILPSHLEFATDLGFAIAALQGSGADSASPFFEKVSGQSAVLGHSMGGGAAILAADLYPTINALAVLAPAETNPSAIAAAPGISVPALIFSGANDCVTPAATNQLPMYNGLAGGCKTYISITGGSHCQMAESNFLCSIGEATCSPSADITRGEQHSVIESYLGNWLDAQLKDDCPAGEAFDTLIAADPLVTYQKTCLQCEALGLADNQLSSTKIYPNPFSDSFTIATPASGTFRLFDAQMRQIYSGSVNETATLDFSHIAKGIYLYTFSGRSGQASGKLVKQ